MHDDYREWPMVQNTALVFIATSRACCLSGRPGNSDGRRDAVETLQWLCKIGVWSRRIYKSGSTTRVWTRDMIENVFLANYVIHDLYEKVLSARL